MPQTIRHCCFNIPHNRTILALALVVTTTASLTAADSLSNRAGAELDPGQAARIAARTQATDAAKVAAKAGHALQIEAAITATLTAERESILWHVQLGQRLTQLALSLVREGDPQAAQFAATLAVRRLEVPANRAEDVRLRVSSWRTIGFVFEEILGDPESAKVSYAEALRLSPDSKMAADELKRIAAAEEGVRRSREGQR